MKNRKYTREEVEALCLKSYIKGMSASDELHHSTRFKIPKRTFGEWVNEVITNLDKDATKENK